MRIEITEAAAVYSSVRRNGWPMNEPAPNSSCQMRMKFDQFHCRGFHTGIGDWKIGSRRPQAIAIIT